MLKSFIQTLPRYGLIFLCTFAGLLPFQHSSLAYANAFAEQSILEEIESSAILFSNHDSKSNRLSQSVYELLNQAQNSILIMTFTLSDTGVIDILNQQAENGVNIQIVIDRDHMSGLHTKLHPSIKIGTRKNGEGHLHHKILVVDQAYVWLGSANFTHDSFVSSHNLAIGFYSPTVATALHEEAEFICSQKPRKYASPLYFETKDQLVELYILPHNQPNSPRPIETEMNQLAKQKLISLIDDAKEQIRISIALWTLKDASQALIAAYQRGVDVQVVTGSVQEEAIQLLINKGVPVKLKGNIHQKWMLVDRQTLLNGSPNWSMNAFSRSDESFLILNDLTPEQLVEMDSILQDLKN